MLTAFFGAAASALAAVVAPSDPSYRLDRVALVLVVLQVLLLYKIARKAETLDGPRLLHAAKLAQDRKHTKEAERQKARERSIPIDELTPAQEALLLKAREFFLSNGGELDELWQPFLLRFLIGHNWDEAKALAHVAKTARWRAREGASAARRRIVVDGWKPVDHPALMRLMKCIGFMPCHRTSYDGDQLIIIDVGSFTPERWFALLSERDFADACVHIFEYILYRADEASMRRKCLVRTAVVLDYEGLAWHHLNPRILLRLRPMISLPDT